MTTALRSLRMRRSEPSPRSLQTLFLKSLHSHILLLLLFSAPTLSCAQENPLPSLETQVAPGIEALKSGDLDTAERIFSSARSEEHTSELQSQSNLVCRLLLEKTKPMLILL